MILQNSLANYSFLTLLGSMIFYWIETSFTGFNVSKNSFINKKNISFAKYGIIASNILLFLLLVERWKESGHFPLSNLYESLMFLSWCFTSLHLYIDHTTSGTLLSLKKESDQFARRLLGAITTPSALLTNAFATFTLPKEMQEVAPLVPALQSNWLMMHVTVMILSYAALILGSLLSIAFLILTADIPNLVNKKSTSEFTNSRVRKLASEFFSVNKEQSFLLSTNNQEILLEKTQNNDNLNLNQSSRNLSINKTEGDTHKVSNNVKNTSNQTIAFMLDNLSYRILGIGFPLLTIGILSGAVWANEAWGSYWSWDPKETWALLTWLTFAIYLHTRLSKGWEGKKPAIIASFGFVIVWICYLGVNLLGEGLHSYGWIIQS